MAQILVSEMPKSILYIMKRIFIFLYLSFWGLTMMAQNQKEIKSSVKEVTVFTNGAQISRSANVNLQVGVTELVFEGVSSYLNVASLQTSGRGNFIIIDTKHNIKYPEPPENPELLIPASLQNKIITAQDSLNDLNYDMDVVKDRKDLFVNQKNMLANNPLMKGGGRSDSLPVLKDVMEFYQTKMSTINTELQKIRREESKLALQKSKVQQRLNDLIEYKNRLIAEKSGNNAPINQVIVTVSAKEAVTGTLSVSYIVSNAGWAPSYDIRVKDVDAPVALSLKANVYQNTGEEWNNVKLTLSTNNPYKNNTRPYLAAWYLNYYMPPSIYTSNVMMKTESLSKVPGEVRGSREDVSMDDKKYIPMAGSTSDYTTQSQNLTSVEYEIDLPYTVPSDGKQHLVSVLENNIQASYNYYAVPKMDKDAFLIARLTGWEELNLMSAKANIYFAGTYIGETMINPNMVNDTLDISLGSDKSIVINRKKLKDKTKEQTLGTSTNKTITMEITVRNNKNMAIDLTMEDQIPVANDKDIKVSFLSDDFTGAYNENTGMLSWKMKLKPKESKIVSFTYTIKYDSSKQLLLK